MIVNILFFPTGYPSYHENLEEMGKSLEQNGGELNYNLTFQSLEKGCYVDLGVDSQETFRVYSDGSIHYIVEISSESEISSRLLKTLTKKGFDLANYLFDDTKYRRRVGLILKNSQARNLYAQKQETFRKFGELLFSEAEVKVLDKSNNRIQLAIKPREEQHLKVTNS